MPLFLLRSARRCSIVLPAALLALAGLVVVGTGPASAHVSVSSTDAAPGGSGKVTFRVPDESATASTVRLRIQLPTGSPFASVSILPVAGWTTTSTRTQLSPPLTDDDGNQVTEAVSVVEFDAVPGGGIAPGQFQEFSLALGPFPDADLVTFNVVQSYSDGSEAAWIDPTVEGRPEPGHPAPTLSLAADGAVSSSASSSAHAHDAATAGEPAGLALFVAILALAVAVAGVVLGLVARRRTVAS